MLPNSKISSRGVRVSHSTEPLHPVRADALQLEQVMVNLVRNAIEAMQALLNKGESASRSYSFPGTATLTYAVAHSMAALSTS